MFINLNDNRGIIIILNHVKPLLDEYVPYSKVKLILDVDPLFVPQLQLHIRAPKHNFENGFKEDIRKINLLIRPLLLKFDLGKEFFIFDGLSIIDWIESIYSWHSVVLAINCSSSSKSVSDVSILFIWIEK